MKQISELFDLYGDRSYGEHVNQREHALQCACLAEAAGEKLTMIAAALLHDVGQFIEGAGDAAEERGADGVHERLGQVFLEQWFPVEVTRPVALHVAAKRYLCAVEPGYLQALSGASALSLRLQGGPFSETERKAFECDPHFRDAVQLRRYDDGGKEPGMATPPLEHYLKLIRPLMK